MNKVNLTEQRYHEIDSENISLPRGQPASISSPNKVISTVLLFSLLSYFGGEILTGSTSIEGIIKYPVTTIVGLIFYGFQVSIIADIAARYRMKMGSVFIAGLIYGIMEEGIALFTMESTASHTIWLSYLGINITWTVYIMLFHAVITVSSTVIIVNILREGEPVSHFLSKRSYAIMIPIIAATYIFLIYGSINSGRVPDTLSVLIIISILFVLLGILFFKVKVKGDRDKKEGTGERKKIFSPAVLWILGMSIPFIIGNRIAPALLPLTAFEIILLPYFYNFFERVIEDIRADTRQLLKYYSIFIISVLVIGTFNRTLISDIVAVSGTVFIIYIGYKKT